MYRYKITIEYDGTGMVGWQRQINPNSVQQHIEEAIRRFSGSSVTLHGAGRTDAGVHAYGMVAHFELERLYCCNTIINAINFHLRPCNIVIIAAELVDEHFHARFSAILRNYKYLIINRPSPIMIDRNRAWHVNATLNVEDMQEAAILLLGTHDFSSFRAKSCQAKSAIKTLKEIKITRFSERIEFYLSAPSFLHHMVRNIVGTLMMIGVGKLAIDDLLKILQAKDRAKAGVTAPACGLYFINVIYNQGN